MSLSTPILTPLFTQTTTVRTNLNTNVTLGNIYMKRVWFLSSYTYFHCESWLNYYRKIYWNFALSFDFWTKSDTCHTATKAVGIVGPRYFVRCEFTAFSLYCFQNENPKVTLHWISSIFLQMNLKSLNYLRPPKLSWCCWYTRWTVWRVRMRTPTTKDPKLEQKQAEQIKNYLYQD